MNNKKKIAVTAGTISALVLIGGAFAFFSSEDEGATGGTAGTVSVDLSGLDMVQKNNINPGDNDPGNTPDSEEFPRRPGSNHDLSFNVENTGNKSIRTKHEITITLEDPALDASVFALYNCIEGEDGEISRDVEARKKYYEVNGEFITEEEYDALEGEKFCSAIKYVIAGDVFDGVGLNNETEELSTVKLDDDGKAIQSYMYSFAMSRDADDAYQGAHVNINVTVFAAQFRNTTAANWYVVGSQDLTSVAGN